MSKKEPVIVKPEYIVYIERVRDLKFIHMDVFKWSKTVKKEFAKEWNEWARKQQEPLYAMPFIDDEKMRKWAVITGFKILEHHKCLDGITRKLYIWR